MTSNANVPYTKDLMMTIDSDDESLYSTDEEEQEIESKNQKNHSNRDLNLNFDQRHLTVLNQEPSNVFDAYKEYVEKFDTHQENDAQSEDDMQDDESVSSDQSTQEKDDLKEHNDKQDAANLLSNDKVTTIHEKKEQKKLQAQPVEDDSSSDDEAYDKSFFSSPENLSTSADSFHSLGLSKRIIKSVEDLGYEKPTPIQSRAIPFLLNGQDVCASAATGSGKTAAFLIPCIERLQFRSKSNKAIRVVILLPTRELAKQCYDNALQFCQYTDIRPVLVIGGADPNPQLQQLLEKPDIVIATPGRLVDHMLNSKKVSLGAVEILVLDEADRLIDMGFRDEVYHITKACPLARQTMLFSATMTDNVQQLKNFALKNPIRIAVDSRKSVASNLTQEFIKVKKSSHEFEFREAALLSLCTRTYTKRVIIFVNRKVDARRLKVLFFLNGLNASELHSDLDANARQAELNRFTEGYTDFLICTDVGSRGIDIPDVEAVINFYMPITLNGYIHRVGRTARAERSGTAVSFTSEVNRHLLKKVVKHSKQQNQTLRQRVVPGDNINYWKDRIAELNPKVQELISNLRQEYRVLMVEKQIENVQRLALHPEEVLKKKKKHLISKQHKTQIQKLQKKEEGVGKNGLEPIKKKQPKMELVSDKSHRQKRTSKLTNEALKHNKIESLQGFAKLIKRQTKRGELKSSGKTTRKSNPSRKRKASEAFGESIQDVPKSISSLPKPKKQKGASKKRFKRH